MVSCAFAVPLLSPTVGRTADDDFPLLLNSADTAILSTRTVASQAAIRKVDSLAALAHVKSGLFFSPEFSLQSELTFEPLRTALRMPHAQHVFSDEGLYLEQLYGKAELDGVLGYGGKLDLPVSLAATVAPGIFGGDYATDYQLREMLAFGGALRFGAPTVGYHSFGVAGFSRDTTWLNAAAFTQPNYGSIDTARTGRLHQSDGGTANTGTPQSPLLTLDGDLGLPSTTYHLAWARLRHGLGSTKDQTDLVIAVRHSSDLGEGIALRPLVEVGRILHNDGSPLSNGALVPASQRADYVTAGLELTWSGWSLSGVRAQRRLIEPQNGTGLDGRSSFESMVTTALGYAFECGLSTAIALKHDHSLVPGGTQNAASDSVGLLVNYHQDF
ncbi:MAG TPA: hypothetical protein VN809_14210 [Telmatospirillum sp.]|nr:hypothetical protein [Telmatospirillum sp.]